MYMKIGVVYQHGTAEAEISKKTMESVCRIIEKLGYVCIKIPFTQSFLHDVQSSKADIIFNAMHGKFGEDGYMQTILNQMQIPYTHSGVYTCSVGMNKISTISYARACGIPTMQNFTILKSDILSGKYDVQKKSFLKPVSGGSSVATFPLEVGRDLDKKQLQEIENYTESNLFMIEEYFAGKEVSIGIFDGKVVGSSEVTHKDDFYSYEAKYLSTNTSYNVPARINDSLNQKLSADALKLFETIGANCISRLDFICNENDYRLLEINTNPGLTERSLIPKICENVGISYEDIIQTLLKTAKFEKI